MRERAAGPYTTNRHNGMRKIFNSIVLLTVLIIVGACSQEEPATLPSGTIRFAIGQEAETGHKAVTRSTPAELGKPLADRFTLAIRRCDNGANVYDGKFVESMNLPIGTYDITASHGEDVPIGRDAPYYIGSARATIEAGKAASVTIPCRVGNALVSVRFGRDAEERARFDRFYSDYGVMVRLGSHSMSITSEQEATSIYFPAGSSPQISFFGTLRSAEGRQVSFELKSDKLPDVFEAADHAIITLSLPDPETAMVVQIGKVEVETVTIDHTLPESWLPAARARATHVYDANGYLVGTDLAILHPYPGAGSKTVVTNADGAIVRTIQGSGNQTSLYSSSHDYPYLPAGTYTVTYCIEQDGTELAKHDLALSVPSPTISVDLGGYTSYTKYKEGNSSAANACDAYTIYSPSAVLKVSEDLLAKYPYTFTCECAGTNKVIPSGVNSVTMDNMAGMTPSLTPYTLTAKAVFDGIAIESTRDFRITGLPVSFAPPKSDEGWETYDAVSFGNDKVQVGSWSKSSYILIDKFAVPQATEIRFKYNLLLRSRAATSSVTITLGSDQLFYASQYALWGNNYTYDDAMTCPLTADATQFKCATKASIGGDNYVYIYNLTLQYN